MEAQDSGKTNRKGAGLSGVLMHHKFLVGVRDEQPEWVVTGSFNITKSAMNNFENMMLIKDEKLATCYFEEYQRLNAL